MIDRAARSLGFLAAVALGVLALGASHARADGTVSGKTAAAASITEQSPLGTWPMDPLNETLLTATIMRGKRHRMLFIQASLDYNGTDGTLIGILPTVNGWGVEPFSSAVAYCTNNLCDTAAGSWWLDLDAAEAAHPGVFVGQPLLVRLLGGEISSSADTNGLWDASLTVQMSRK